jgi:hypothetical protein
MFISVAPYQLLVVIRLVGGYFSRYIKTKEIVSGKYYYSLIKMEYYILFDEMLTALETQLKSEALNDPSLETNLLCLELTAFSFMDHIKEALSKLTYEFPGYVGCCGEMKQVAKILSKMLYRAVSIQIVGLFSVLPDSDFSQYLPLDVKLTLTLHTDYQNGNL